VGGWSPTGRDRRSARVVGLDALQGLFVMGVAGASLEGKPRIAKMALSTVGIGWIVATIGLAVMATNGDSPLAFLSGLIG